MIPILHNHNPNDIIGSFDNGIVTLRKGIVLNERVLHDMFGNLGIHIMEEVKISGFTLVSKFKILEWSL